MAPSRLGDARRRSGSRSSACRRPGPRSTQIHLPGRQRRGRWPGNRRFDGGRSPRSHSREAGWGAVHAPPPRRARHRFSGQGQVGQGGRADPGHLAKQQPAPRPRSGGRAQDDGTQTARALPGVRAHLHGRPRSAREAPQDSAGRGARPEGRRADRGARSGHRGRVPASAYAARRARPSRGSGPPAPSPAPPRRLLPRAANGWIEGLDDTRLLLEEGTAPRVRRLARARRPLQADPRAACGREADGARRGPGWLRGPQQGPLRSCPAAPSRDRAAARVEDRAGCRRRARQGGPARLLQGGRPRRGAAPPRLRPDAAAEGAGHAGGEGRQVADVVYLAPNDLVLHALRRDEWLVRRGRPREALFLRLKSHATTGKTGLSWYIKASAVSLYAAILRNQPA